MAAIAGAMGFNHATAAHPLSASRPQLCWHVLCGYKTLHLCLRAIWLENPAVSATHYICVGFITPPLTISPAALQDGLPFGHLALRQVGAFAVANRSDTKLLACWWTNSVHLRHNLRVVGPS